MFRLASKWGWGSSNSELRMLHMLHRLRRPKCQGTGQADCTTKGSENTEAAAAAGGAAVSGTATAEHPVPVY